MKRIALAVVLLFGFATPVWAGAYEELLLRAAQGEAEAQYKLGIIYTNGQGVALDFAEAVKWFRKAAEQGHAGAQNDLGGMYYRGRGLPRDFSEALKWSRRATERGHAGAQVNLGTMYAKGEAVSQDLLEAYVWFTMAALQGSESGATYQDRAEKYLSQSQITEARTVARSRAQAVAKYLDKLAELKRSAAARDDSQTSTIYGSEEPLGLGGSWQKVELEPAPADETRIVFYAKQFANVTPQRFVFHDTGSYNEYLIIITSGYTAEIAFELSKPGYGTPYRFTGRGLARVAVWPVFRGKPLTRLD